MAGAVRSSVSRSAAWLGLLFLGVGDCSAAEDARRELDVVVKRLNALDTWLDDAGARIANAQKELESADRRIAATTGRIRELDARIDDGRAEVAELDAEGERLEAARRRLTARVADDLRDAWRFSERDPVVALLNLEDPGTLQRMVRYHAAFAQARRAAVSELRETQARLAGNGQARDSERRALEESRRTATAERGELVNDRAKRLGLINDLHAELAKRSAERERLTRDRKRLESLLAELARASRRSSTAGLPADREGDLPWPVNGRLVRRFGEPRAGGRLRWEGVTFAAPEGSEVRAVASGTVVFADWLRGFGLLAIIDHGDGWMSLYGSVDAIYKRRDESVALDEVIATVGQSGGESEVGLYFEVRHNGVPKDPLAWLRADSTRRRR